MSYFRWLQTATGRNDGAERARREDDALTIIGLHLAGDDDAATDALGTFPTQHNVPAMLWLVAFFCDVLTSHGHTPDSPPDSLGAGCAQHPGAADGTCPICAEGDADFFVAAYQHDTTELTTTWRTHTRQHGPVNLAVIALAHRTAIALGHALFHQQPRWWYEPAILPDPEEVHGPGWPN